MFTLECNFRVSVESLRLWLLNGQNIGRQELDTFFYVYVFQHMSQSMMQNTVTHLIQ